MYRFLVYHNGRPGAAMQQLVYRSAPFHWILYVLAHLYAFDWIDKNVARWFMWHGAPGAAEAIRWVLDVLSWGNDRDLASSMKMATVVFVVTMPCWIMFWRLRQIALESIDAKMEEEKLEEYRADAGRRQELAAEARRIPEWLEMERDLQKQGVIAASFTEEELDKLSQNILKKRLKPLLEKYPEKFGEKKSTDGDGSVVAFGAPIVTVDGDILFILDDRALRYSPGTNTITADIPIQGLPIAKLTRHLGSPMVRGAPELDEASGKYKPIFLYGDDKRKFEIWSFDVRAVNNKRQNEFESQYGGSLVDRFDERNKKQTSYDVAVSINLARFMTGLDSAFDDHPYRGFHPYVIYLPMSRPTEDAEPVVDTSQGSVIGFGGPKSWKQARDLMDLSDPDLL